MDRFDYSTAIAESWKQQTLLNIVKLRYADLPVFVDVASVVSGYSLETGLSAGATLPESRTLGGDTFAVGGSSLFTERPTITYVPLTGERFLRGLITPIDPKHIFFMLQAGYSADFILGLTVEGLNGVNNLSTAGGVVRDADPGFVRVLHLLREVQAAGAFGLRAEETKGEDPSAVLFFRTENLSSEIADKTVEIRRLLNLPVDRQRFVLNYSAGRGNEDELNVNSRSMLQIMSVFSDYVDVPAEHLSKRWTQPTFEHLDQENRPGKLQIHSGKTKPTDAFTAVNYRGYWYWIDESDWRTKSALTSVMFFFTLAETDTNDKLPLVTIPAQ